MNRTEARPTYLARLALLAALALHLAGAALGPWAHALDQADRRAVDVGVHPGQLHAEAAEPSHAPCAFCATVGQPSLAGPPAPVLPLADLDLSPGWRQPGVQLARIATGDQARAPPLVHSGRTDRA